MAFQNGRSRRKGRTDPASLPENAQVVRLLNEFPSIRLGCFLHRTGHISKPVVMDDLGRDRAVNRHIVPSHRRLRDMYASGTARISRCAACRCGWSLVFGL
jgi:hypothetical protein